jgi:hypothetical protein
VYSLTNAMYFAALDAQAAVARLASMREQVAKVRQRAQGAAADALAAFDTKAEALQGGTSGGGRGAGAGGRGGRGGTGADTGAPAVAATGGPAGAVAAETLPAAAAALSGVMNLLQAADVQPTAIQLAAITSAQQTTARAMARWAALEGPDLAALNATLKTAGLAAITPR